MSQSTTAVEGAPGTASWVPARALALQIAITYLAIAAAWIFVSGYLLQTLVTDPELRNVLESAKGSLLVLVTALLLGASLHRYFAQIRASAQLLAEKQDKLRQNERLFRGLFEQAAVGMAQVGMDGKWITVNQQLCDLLGYSPEELLQRSFQEVTHPDDLAADLDRRARLKNGELRTSQIEKRYIRKDGSVFWGKASLSLVRDSEALPEYYIAVVESIEERKRAEEQAGRWQRVFQESDFGLAHARASDNTFLEVNAAFARQRGYTPEELAGHPFLEIYAPEDREEMKKRIARIDAEGHLVFESTHLRRDGTRFPVLVEVTAIRDAAGRPVSRVAYVLDLTDLREAEQALRESALRLQMAARAGNVGLWDWDLRTNRVFFSTEWKRQLGCEDHEISNDFAEWQDRVHPADLERCLTYIRKFIETPWPDYQLEFRLRHKNGSYRWILARAALLDDEQGNRARMLGSHVDITERKAAEETLHELSAHLLRAQDLERRHISRELHDVTAQHLAALSLNLNQLRRLTAQSLPHAEELCADSIALAKQAAQEIRTQSYLLHPPLLESMGLVAAITDYAQGFATRSGIRVMVAPAADFGRLPEEMELALLRVVQESLANVLRHSGSNRAEIVFARTELDATLEVRDHGHGLPADMLARFQTMKGAFGVGLGGMHERLRLLGGRLDIESGPQGTTIRAQVPLAQSRTSAPPTTTNP